MIEKMNVSWTVSDRSASNKGGNISNPEWREIEEKLLLSLTGGGTVTLDAEDENGHPSSLQVRAEGGKFVVMLGQEAQEGWRVRTYKNPASKLESISILGDMWNDQLVCRDASLVMAVFSEFFGTGDVSEIPMSS
jgi:hypothetical protein